MTFDKLLLSICIPTYNRSGYLKKSIESIISQKPFLDGEVEIVISDNASTDDTEEVVRRFVKNHTNIFYYKNSINVRDKNFPLVLSKGHGKLRKLSNDTLVYDPGAISTICDIVKRYQFDRPQIFWGNGELNRCNGMYDYIEAIRKIGYWSTSISCFSVWENDCVNIEQQTKGCELLLWQVHYFFSIASYKKKILIYNDRIFNTQTVPGKNISYGLFNVFYHNYLSIIKEFVDKGSLSSTDYDYLEKDVLMNFFVMWTIKWEKTSKHMQYSKDEDLKKLLFKISASKPYNKELKKKYILTKLKFIVKQPLVKLKRWFLRKSY